MRYYFKVWLFTVLVSPLFVVAELVYQEAGNFSNFFGGLPIWLLTVLFGSAFALPSLFLFRLFSNNLAKHGIPVYINKLIHAIVGIVLLWITFFIMNPTIFKKLSRPNVIWLSAYSLTLIAGTFIYKIQDKQT